MHALSNGSQTVAFKMSDSNDRVKVIYHSPAVHFQGIGKWKTREDARRVYRNLIESGFAPAPMPAELAAMYAE